MNIWKHLGIGIYGTDSAVPKERERRVTIIFAKKVTLGLERDDETKLRLFWSCLICSSRLSPKNKSLLGFVFLLHNGRNSSLRDGLIASLRLR